MFKQSIIYFLYIEMGFCFVNPCFKTKVSLRRPRWKYAGQMYSNNANMDESKISREELIEARVNKQYWSLSDLYDNIEKKKISVAAIGNEGSFVDVLDINNNRHTIDILPSDVNNIENLLRKNNIRFAIQKKQFQNLSNTFNLIGSILIPSALLFYVFALFRRLNNTNDPGSGGGLFGNSLSLIHI